MTEPARTPLAVAPPPAVKKPPTAAELRRARARRLLIRYALWVGIPTVLATIYYGACATPQYDAHASFSIESNDPGADVDRKGGSSHQRDARLVRDHIRSREMMDSLAEAGLIAHYQGDDIDWWSRLASDAGRDKTYSYYRHKVDAVVDPESSVVDVRVRAFSPKVAQAAVRTILERSKEFIASMSATVEDELLKPAEAEVVKARARLGIARKAMFAVTGGLEPTPEQLSEPAVMERELAQLALNSALEAQQDVHLQAIHAKRFVLLIDEATLPDHATRPRPVWDILTVFASAMVLVSVLSLLGTSVREHANF